MDCAKQLVQYVKMYVVLNTIFFLVTNARICELILRVLVRLCNNLAQKSVETISCAGELLPVMGHNGRLFG